MNGCFCNLNYDELIYSSKYTLNFLSKEEIKKLFWKYSCDIEVTEKINELLIYLDILNQEFINTSLGGFSCLNCCDEQHLKEKVLSLLRQCDTNSRFDFIKDTSSVDKWIINNPFCVSREKWEKFAYRVCGILNLEIKSTEVVCDITFDIVKKILPCDVILAISVYEQVCNLGLSISRDEKECKLDFKILKNEIPCDLTFNIYKKLIACNLSFDIIKTIYTNNCSLEINDEGDAVLVTQYNSYKLKDLSFVGEPDIKKLASLGVDISNSEFHKNSNFIKKLNQDYSGYKNV